MPKSKIDETLKKIATNTPKANTPTTSSRDGQLSTATGLGDPNCPYCHGAGYLRTDVPVGHPNFGRLEICVCRQRDVSQQVRERLYSLSRLDELKELTFDTFQPRGRKGLGEMHASSLEMAFNQAYHYAKNLNGWLLLRGGYGCGKTHLAAAIANYAVEMGVPTLFLTVPDLLDMLRFSYDSEDTTFEERFNEIRNASLLVLDDFGTQNATGWAQEKLFQIINYRYINKLSMVVTTNLNPDELDARFRSRLADRELVTDVRINAPDYRRPLDDIGNPELSSLGLMVNKTFGSFEERLNEGLPPEGSKSLQKALKAAHAFAERPRGWLVFLGGYGSGKTHLAAAIANYRAGLGDPPLFVMVPDLLDHLRATFSPNSSVAFDRRFDEIRTAPLLILDDLGTQSMTAWVREKLYQLFNYRYNAELPTVITSSDSLDEMDARIRSRLLDGKLCSIYAITVPSYHGGRGKKTKK
ncbi:MAG TPA: ATP-binding protein [Anaerolineales bacterium]|nr:ATP-binding protein [Anaerolineales bacterium]